jgi:threonine/homoserine/homoserine lactone efflux protein
VKWLGIGYLTYLGIMLLRSKGTLDPSLHAATDNGPGTPRSLFLKSLLVAITNLKGYLFFSAFLPQFVVPTSPQVPQYVVLALIFASLDFLIMLAYAVLGSQAMRVLKRSGALWLSIGGQARKASRLLVQSSKRSSAGSALPANPISPAAPRNFCMAQWCETEGIN